MADASLSTCVLMVIGVVACVVGAFLFNTALGLAVLGAVVVVLGYVLMQMEMSEAQAERDERAKKAADGE